MTLALHRSLNPEKLKNKLLLKQFKLTPAERLEMVARGTLLSQFAIPIGSAIYFLWTQVRYALSFTNHTGTVTYSFFAKDTWDRLPIHIQNLLHNQMFGITTQYAPAWWVTARHDFRHVLIGFLAVLLVGAFGVGLKAYEPISKARMLLSVPVSFFAASITAAGGIAFFAWHPVSAFLSKIGANPSIPFVGDLVGKGTLQLTIIGVLAGLVARKILAPTFAQLQLMSIDRNIAQGDNPTIGWKRFVYPANYRNRFRLVSKQCELGIHTATPGSRWMGIALSFAVPVAAALLAFGVWLNYAGGPATGAH